MLSLLLSFYLVAGATGPADLAQELQTAQTMAQAGDTVRATSILSALLKEVQPESVEAALICNGLGIAAGNAGRYSDAEKFYRRAIHIFVARRGPADEATLKIQQNLASLYVELNRPDEAEALMIRVVEARRQNPGKNAIGLADAVDILGTIHVLRKRPDSEAHFREAMDLLTTHGQQDTLQFAMVLNHLACWFAVLRRYPEVRPLAEQSLHLLEAHPESSPGERLMGLMVLAAAESKTGPIEAAESRIKRALEMAEATFGPEHLRVGWILASYAALLRDAHRKDEARPLQERSNQILATFNRGQATVGIEALLMNQKFRRSSR